jgi:hypothetical protein
MKTITRTLILSFFLFAGLQLKAQSIPNASFENWTTDSVVGMAGTVYFDHPVDWMPFTSMFNALFGGSINLYQSSSSFGFGNSAVMIETDLDSNGADLISIFPISTVPPKLYGYYKYEGSPSEAASVNAFFFHYDAVNDSNILVAQGTELLSSFPTSYTQFEVDITPIVALSPDTVFIFIEYLYDTPGNRFYVDALSFDPSTGIEAPLALPELSVYPLPFENELNVEWDAIAGQTYQLSLMSLTGQKVWEDESRQGRVSIATSGMPKGIYILQWSDGNRVQTRKLIR